MLAALAAFAAQAAVIYKWTDADGVVHFSDQPVPGAEKISTGATNTATSGAPGTAPAPATDGQQKAGALDYAEFSITSPTPEQTFFGDEPINANLALESQPEGGPDRHLASERRRNRRSGTGRDVDHPAALGSRHLRHRRDRHGSGDGPIAKFGQRHLLRSAALRAVAAISEALTLDSRQPDAPIGR